MAKHKINPDELPSNNILPVNENGDEEKKIGLVGTVTVGQKKPQSRITREVRGISSYLFEDVLLPAIKRILHDFVLNGLDMALWGSPQRRNRSLGQRSYTDYGASYSRINTRQPGFERQPMRRGRQAEQLATDILFSDPNDADMVLSMMIDRVYQYGWCTVGDLHSLSGSNVSSPLYEQYGWDNLSMARVRGDGRSGYYIDLPTPVYFRN